MHVDARVYPHVDVHVDAHVDAFKARLIVNSQMLENDKTLTHGDARRALVQCLVAAKKFFRYVRPADVLFVWVLLSRGSG